MKTRILKSLIAVFFAWLAALPACAVAQRPVSYAELVKQMTNLEGLAVLPAAGECAAQCSSYDRASKVDVQTGLHVAWDANADGDGVIRTEGEQIVMAEMVGPGCIWRIWSATAKQGRVRIYLDGQETPAVDLPFEKYFTGDTAPFAYPALSYDLNRSGCSGQNLYFPIPYQKSCKIVADKDWGAYYHFTYTTFPKDTRIPTFSAALAAENRELLKQVDEFYQKKLGADPAGKRSGEETMAKSVSVAAGRTTRVCEITGARAITAIRVKADFKNREDQMAALRKLVLRIHWDGQEKSAVWCPLGDFFGTAPGENLYQSLVTGMTNGGYYAYWYMPFGKHAVVDLISEDCVDRQVAFEVVHAPLNRPFDGLGHFHAKWHRDTFPLSKDRWPDWVMLRTEGRGRFCGVMLHVWNPLGGWWGEGDEKFFVDGETFPSTFGTGSEDYFGYAWCKPDLFQRPFHGQTMTQNNQGHQSVFRWHILDNVPFQQSFEACIEKYYSNEEKGTLYACLPIWYLAPDGEDSYEPLSVEQRHAYYVRPQTQAGGFLVMEPPPGNVTTQKLSGRWKDEGQLWWTDAKPGDKLDLAVDVKKSGNYGLSASLTKARDYGIVQLHLDGERLGEPIDLYDPEVILTETPLPLGSRQLSAGVHRLTVEILGANEKAVKSYMFGLDQFILVPEKP